MYNSICSVILSYYPDVQRVTQLIHGAQSMPVIVVDNTPINDSRYHIPKKHVNKHVTFIQTAKNFGFAGGMNIGIKNALHNNPKWLILLNQDIQISTFDIDIFTNILKRSKPGIYGPFQGGYISGACMAIHRDVIKEIGYFYEPYFMYYEDPDLCIRAKKAGFPLVHIPLDGIEHIDTSSLGKGSFLHEYYLARNHLLFVERMAPLRVKMYEYLRLPKTIFEYWRSHNIGALTGCKDYFIRAFGEKRTI